MFLAEKRRKTAEFFCLQQKIPGIHEVLLSLCRQVRRAGTRCVLTQECKSCKKGVGFRAVCHSCPGQESMACFVQEIIVFKDFDAFSARCGAVPKGVPRPVRYGRREAHADHDPAAPSRRPAAVCRVPPDFVRALPPMSSSSQDLPRMYSCVFPFSPSYFCAQCSAWRKAGPERPSCRGPGSRTLPAKRTVPGCRCMIGGIKCPCRGECRLQLDDTLRVH